MKSVRKLCIYSYVVIIASLYSTAQSAASQKVSDTTGALLYLSKFGYIDSASNPKTGALISEETVRNAIREFQAFAKINITGELDEETKVLMNTPRCGVQDKIGYGANAKRRKRYALQGSRWRVRDLTYKISKYPLDLTKAEVDRDIKKAFEIWTESTDLTFKQVKGTGKIHIEIKFEKGEHGDGDPFDGPGGTLAHAYFPIYGGDAHFDQSEAWTVDTSRGTNLFQVAAHEFGHSLGLSHSDIQTALMAPFYRGYIPNFRLDKDDIRAIQSLYGQTKTDKSTPKPSERVDTPESTTPVNSICSKKKIDTIVTMDDEHSYVFIGSEYWKLLADGISEGYPRSIAKDFDGLASDLDAAFTWIDTRKTYFFKGPDYWRFTDRSMDKGYPKKIAKGFEGIPDNIDAAFVWSGNGKIYFFKGKNYWRFDPQEKPPVKLAGTPKLVSNWKSIPNDVDAALQYSNGYTYFFKDGNYWRFNDRSFSADKADPPFPRLSAYWWFGCKDKGNQQYNPVENRVDTDTSLDRDDDMSGDRKFDADDLSIVNSYPILTGRKSSIKFGEEKKLNLEEVQTSTNFSNSGSKRLPEFTALCLLCLIYLSDKFTLSLCSS